MSRATSKVERTSKSSSRPTLPPPSHHSAWGNRPRPSLCRPRKFWNEWHWRGTWSGRKSAELYRFRLMALPSWCVGEQSGRNVANDLRPSFSLHCFTVAMERLIEKAEKGHDCRRRSARRTARLFLKFSEYFGFRRSGLTSRKANWLQQAWGRGRRRPLLRYWRVWNQDVSLTLWRGFMSCFQLLRPMNPAK